MILINGLTFPVLSSPLFRVVPLICFAIARPFFCFRFILPLETQQWACVRCMYNAFLQATRWWRTEWCARTILASLIMQIIYFLTQIDYTFIKSAGKQIDFNSSFNAEFCITFLVQCGSFTANFSLQLRVVSEFCFFCYFRLSNCLF